MTDVAVDSLLVLLVEDNPADARLVQANLRDGAAGPMRVTHVGRLAEALPALRAEEPACVLLDLGLPDAEGLEAVEHLLARAPHIPIIVLTGRDDDGLGVAAVNLGAQDYLGKSDVQPRALVRAIRYAVERAAFTEALRQSEEAYRLVFSANPQPVLVYEQWSRVVVAANGAASALCGRSIDDLCGTVVDNLVVEDQRPAFVRALARLPEGPTSLAGTWTYPRPDGTHVLLEVSSSEVWFDGHAARMAVLADVSDRERAVEGLRASEERYRTIVETAREGIWAVDAGFVVTFVNCRMAAMLGYAVHDMLGKELSAFVDPGSAAVLRSQVDDDSDSDRPGPCEVAFVRSDGALLWGLVAAGPLVDERGETAGCIGMVTDLTERRRAEESLRRWAAVVESSDDAILAHALDGAILAWNPGAQRMFGYSADAAIGSHASLTSPVGRENELTPILARVAAGERVEHYETVQRRQDGSMVPVSMTISPIYDEGEVVTAAAVIVRDVTERRDLEAELRRQALRDDLTGLPNRTLIADRLEQALERAERLCTWVGVLFLDLDRFKTVNDSQGHSCGDELLVLVAARLSEAVRADDTVARLGGDEFVVVCEGIEPDGRTAEAVAARITAALEEPFVVGGTEIVITVSIGIAVGSGGDAPEDLLRDADAAMYQAKEQGRARAEMFDEEMRARADHRLALASALRRAVVCDELELEYQAVVSLVDGSILGAEALLRWRHPDHGPMRPAEFVAVAEETGLIVPIGRWVLEEALTKLASWRRLLPGLTMAVNVSPRQLALADFFDTVVSCVAAAGVDPAALVLEITEGVLMDDVSASLAALAGLRNAGVTLAVDDFGTGYSSLSYLKRLPLDVLKIDRAFVKGLPADAHDSAIVSAVVALSRTFDLAIVAEGVESVEQASALLALGCGAGQGFHFGRPVGAPAFEGMLARQAEQGAGLPWHGHVSQREPTCDGPGDRARSARTPGLPRGLRYRDCPRCGNKGVYLVPGRPILRCKYCAVFTMLSMTERALAEASPDSFVSRLRSERAD